MYKHKTLTMLSDIILMGGVILLLLVCCCCCPVSYLIHALLGLGIKGLLGCLVTMGSILTIIGGIAIIYIVLTIYTRK